MGKRGPAVVVVVAALGSAVLLGSQLVSNPGVVLPLALQPIALGWLTVVLLRLEPDRAGRRFLYLTLALAIGLRGVVAFGVYGVLDPGFFAPDTASYFAQGKQIFDYWSGVPGEPEILDHWQRSYAYLNAWGFRLFGDPTWFMVVLNVFVSLWTVVLTYLIALRCFGVVTARVAAVLTAVFPSLVLWSVLNIRDPLTAFLVVAIVYLGVRVFERPRVREAALLVAGAIALSTVRDYMGFLVMAGLMLGLLAALRPDKVAGTLLLGSAIVLAVTFGLEQSGVFTRDFIELPFQQTSVIRRSLQQDFVSGLAGSAFGVGVEIATPGDALRFLPVGLAYFLFAPFPWAIASLLQLATLPEVLLWYSLVPFLVMGLWVTRRGEYRPALLLVGVLVLTVSSYALVEGNFGTAYRHRAQIMPLFFVFCAKGIANSWNGMRSRAAERNERRASARLTMIESVRRPR